MVYDFLVKDLPKTQKAIGTDKGLAKIGDSIVNLTYSVAKSIFLTNNQCDNKIIRTGQKVNKQILAEALKKANMKNFAKNRADAHDLADTVEAILAYVWINRIITIDEIIDLLKNNLSYNIINRVKEIEIAANAFAKLLDKIKEFLPEKKI
ncbi:MAG: hypothetical protein JXA99_07465 [Candidatus Lokiarchaeota archaeon]|nr:hypothetical protein [Candidatus Lokiarchaeota archaeon]